MRTDKKTARIAGIWYLVMAVTATFGILIVPAQVLIPGDAATTAKNILANETFFRAGIVSSLMCQIAFIFLVLNLYHIFKKVNYKYSLLMLSFVLVSIPIACINTLSSISLIASLTNQDFISSFTPNQAHSFIALFIVLQKYGTIIAQIFWGLWLFPFALLIFQSNFIPKIFAVFLILAGVSYLVHSVTVLLAPKCGDVIAHYTALPEGLGELAIIVWLLLKGVTKPNHGADTAVA